MLHGKLVEGEPEQAPVFLSDLENDPSESHNLAEAMPELTEQLRQKAETWRAGIEQSWSEQWAHNYTNLTR